MLFDENVKATALPLSLLKNITDDFTNNNEIGNGGFAVVYKGLLENGVVAVKKLANMSVTDERRFLGEVECLMKAKHKNIVRFLGYCSDSQGQWVEYNGKSVMGDVRQRLLCFEYVPNRSLDKYIKGAHTSLEWGKRYQIIKGVCEGLHFLHKKNIVHSDLKPANILLDNDMTPKITDFGISRCFDGKQTHIITKSIIGSRRYLAPEGFYGKISFKSDIFSLGVTIIEILTLNEDYPDVLRVLKCWEHRLEKSQKDQELEQISVCTKVAQSCLEFYPAKRPSAQDIIDILKQKEGNEWPIETGGSSSTVPYESSHVEDKSKSSSSTGPKAYSFAQNKNMPPRRRHRRIC
ncbi:hypothetical protein HU200_046551 [Digitaria exilis]|uniref:non-specific serine/threonine protein kinase n=1 Tax=Digitaria exilis TaxID=1010633 RepID=A0A835AYH1_9POAL|nr:hypothetical protein HU200_046551 [Digitaria exilis]